MNFTKKDYEEFLLYLQSGANDASFSALMEFLKNPVNDYGSGKMLDWLRDNPNLVFSGKGKVFTASEIIKADTMVGKRFLEFHELCLKDTSKISKLSELGVEKYLKSLIEDSGLIGKMAEMRKTAMNDMSKSFYEYMNKEGRKE